VIAAVVKTFSGLASLIFMLLMISQFITYFNYSLIPNVIAVALAAGVPAPGVVLIGMINGFGGGFLRDLTVGNTPSVLRPGRYYLSAAFVACILFVVLEVYLHVTATVAAWIVIGLFFTIRALAVRYNWQTQPVLVHVDADAPDAEAQ
jgi:uncharacterized membrane protein YeiH